MGSSPTFGIAFLAHQRSPAEPSFARREPTDAGVDTHAKEGLTGEPWVSPCSHEEPGAGSGAEARSEPGAVPPSGAARGGLCMRRLFQEKEPIPLTGPRARSRRAATLADLLQGSQSRLW